MEHDPGFDPVMFAGALRAISRLPLAEFMACGLTRTDVAAPVDRAIDWAATITTESLG